MCGAALPFDCTEASSRRVVLSAQRHYIERGRLVLRDRPAATLSHDLADVSMMPRRGAQHQYMTDRQTETDRQRQIDRQAEPECIGTESHDL